jgi:nucleoside-diphosphate-sugar epimerase
MTVMAGGAGPMVNRSFWKGRRVFLTGHTGFKGSWLSLWLDALGADVTGFALDPPTQPSLFVQAESHASSHPSPQTLETFHGSELR